MYESIRPWIDVEVTVKPFIGRTATGDKIFGESYKVLCYPVGEVNIVRNWQGIEVLSNNKLHIDGSVKITKLDNIFFNGEDLPVQAISEYYRNGKPDIKVVYV